MSYAYYRFFTGDYMRDTMHLGWFEDLAYRRLIDLYLLHGKPIRNDRAYILRAVRATEPEQQQAVDNVLAEFFQLQADGWHQSKCNAELHWRATLSNTAKRAVAAREQKRIINKIASGDDREIINRSSNQNQNQNQITPKSKPFRASYDAHFETFWLAYPRKKSKGNAAKAWARIPAEFHQPIMAGLAKAKASTDWKKENGTYIPYPASWLNARGWEDEQQVKVERVAKFESPW